MRHNKNFNHLGRQAGHRKALMSNMASSLILHKRIETTVAKAKAVRQFIEPLVTKSKDDTTHSRRIVFSYLKQKEAVTELFRTIAPKIADRPGGYTRILKTGFRLGDAADMCDEDTLAGDFIAMAMGSAADLCIVPMQDYLKEVTDYLNDIISAPDFIIKDNNTIHCWQQIVPPPKKLRPKRTLL